MKKGISLLLVFLLAALLPCAAFAETVTRGYLAAFPELEGKYSVHFCRSADGLILEDEA